MIHNLIMFLSLICLPLAAAPCSIGGLRHEIQFEPQSVALGTKNALALVDWFIKQRDGEGVIDIWISAYSIDDTHAIEVSRERMRNIARIIKPLNKNNVPVELHISGPVPAYGPLAFFSNLAVVEVQPACLKTNTCCPQPIKQQDGP